MTLRVLLPVLMAGAAAVPAGVPVLTERVAPPSTAAATDLMIRSITLNPHAPVVGPTGSVRLVIEVVARGVAGPEGMTVQVEPGAPPESAGGAGSDVLLGPVSGPGPGQGGGRLPASPALTYTVPPRTAHPVGRAPYTTGEWETWRFEPDKKLSRWYPAGPWNVAATARGADGGTVTRYAGFQLRRDTKFSSVQVARKGAGVVVRGVLNRVDPQGYLDYAPFPGQTVEILHRAAGERRWTRAAETTTDIQGQFLQNVTGYQDHEWRARFMETDRYATGRSRVHQAARQ
ncbi:hypothetical protein [Streptosporangium sp. NPDC087985]|uniref:hypothetical protein n=1 Tax=Streptosporangium sp. NPDC087985 TaxID=3366196 RepID=UPI003823C20A